MSLPLTLPGDPAAESKSITLTGLPDWLYWRLVSVAETENEDLTAIFAVAARAIISDFDAVEAVALKKFVTKHAAEGYSDPAIAKMLDIPPRRVRAVRVAYGIESCVQGRGRKKVAAEKALELVA